MIPYSTYYGAFDGAGAVSVASEPVRLLGWNYHNEQDFTVYMKVFNLFTFSPLTDAPFLRIGMPPEQSSGHIFNAGGIKLDVAMSVATMASIANFTFQDFGDNSISVTLSLFYVLESEVL